MKNERMMKKIYKKILLIGMTIFTITNGLLAGCGNSEGTMSKDSTETVEIATYQYMFRELPQPIYIEAAENFSGGDGTAENPYQISTIEELMLMSNLIEDSSFDNKYPEAFYELTADIILNEGDAAQWDEVLPQYSWKPIGMYPGSFEGNFNGNGYMISGLYINADNADEESASFTEYGLFGDINGGNVENVRVDNSYICVSGYMSRIGGIAGKICDTQITNCEVNAYIEFYDSDCGGVIGNISGGDNKVSNCTFFGKIRGKKEKSFSNIGGIAGSGDGEIEDCVNYGNIYGVLECADTMGGIIGRDSFGIRINECENYGSVQNGVYTGGIAGKIFSSNIAYNDSKERFIEKCHNAGTISGNKMAGGIVGHVGNSGGKRIYINGCENIGEIKDGGEVIGGIIGKGECDGEGIFLSDCVNRTNLTSEAKTGGIAGVMYSQKGNILFRNCKNEGNIESFSKGTGTGGIIGQYYINSKMTQIDVEKCENTGKIIADSSVGGVIGTMTRASLASEKVIINIVECKNSGEVVTHNNNTFIGGIIGGAGVENGKVCILSCKNEGNLTVLDPQVIEPVEEKEFSLTRMCGGIVGRVGETLFLSTDADDKENPDIINEKNANVVIEDCFSSGKFNVPDEKKYKTLKGEEIYENACGGIIGTCSGNEGYSINVINCTYKNANRGMGAEYLMDVGKCVD